jgi:1,4-dihydroxy-2-naphthoate octaprenyltransferase
MNVWIEAARPRTLTIAISPVLVGTASAEETIVWRFGAALIVALAIQIGVNFANDYSDGRRGVDTPARVGPRRATAAGLVTPEAMKVAVVAALTVAAGAGLALAAATSYVLVAVGALCFIAALAYSGGPRPYASVGLGEVFVFVFFGLVATAGSAYVQTERITLVAVFSAIPVGLLATAVLVVNNLRDMSTDAAVGKLTLAVRIGRTRTTSLYRGLVLGSYPWLILVAGGLGTAWPLLPFASLPFALRLMRTASLLTGTARLQLGFSVLLASGLWLS